MPSRGRRRSAWLIPLCLAPLGAPLAETCVEETLRTELGQRLARDANLTGVLEQGQRISDGPTETDSRYVRYRFRVIGDGGNWSLTIRDNKWRVLESFGPETPLSEGSSFWTGRLPTEDGLKIDLDLTLPHRTISLVEYVSMPARSDKEQVYYSANDRENPRWYPVENEAVPLWHRAADQVGLVIANSGPKVWSCTGVALASDLLLTNWHCGYERVVGADEPSALQKAVWSEAVCRDTFVDFSWDSDQRSAEFRCAAVLSKDADLDYTLLHIVPLDGHRALQGVTLADGPPAANVGDLKIIHHPAARRKQVTTGCRIAALDLPGWRDSLPTRFAHLCDTAPGSSGAPVFDAERRLIGLHHHGFDRPADDCTAKGDGRNKAIRLDLILAHLKARAGTIAQQHGIILEEKLRRANP